MVNTSLCLLMLVNINLYVNKCFLDQGCQKQVFAKEMVKVKINVLRTDKKSF